jgi:hypothetical protein
MQDNAMAHTDNNSTDALDEIFGEQFLSQRLWPLKSPSLNAYDVYICGMLKEELYVNNQQNFKELQENNWNELPTVSIH